MLMLIVCNIRKGHVTFLMPLEYRVHATAAFGTDHCRQSAVTVVSLICATVGGGGGGGSSGGMGGWSAFPFPVSLLLDLAGVAPRPALLGELMSLTSMLPANEDAFMPYNALEALSKLPFSLELGGVPDRTLRAH